MSVPFPLRTLRRAGAATLVLGLGLTTAAHAAPTAPGRYVTRTLAQPAASGLPVTGPLSDFRALAGARVVVPTTWKLEDTSGGRLRFLVVQNHACRYRLTYSVTAALAAPQDAAQRVATAVPAAGTPYVLSEGQRDGGAFRVVRQKTGADGRVRLTAQFSDVLTRRDDIVAPGQVAWGDVRVTATSLAGSECHAGTWRSALGPAIGDSLAVTRLRLNFKKA